MAFAAAFALTALGAGPALADNHAGVVPQGQDGAFEHVAPQRQAAVDGQSEHLAPQGLVVGDLATN